MYFPACFLRLSLDPLTLSLPAAPLYGKAEFQSGMDEPTDDTPVPSKSNPTTEHDMPKADQATLKNMSEGYSTMQKGLFLFGILFAVAVYLRVTGKKGKELPEKSMV